MVGPAAATRHETVKSVGQGVNALKQSTWAFSRRTPGGGGGHGRVMVGGAKAGEVNALSWWASGNMCSVKQESRAQKKEVQPWTGH